METKPTLTLDQPAPYRLRLQGRVSANWQDWLKDPTVNFEEDQTVVTGIVRDQAALFGLLSFVRDLGVPLVSVEFIQDIGEHHGQELA
jgi:hypothetical protein